MSKTKMIQVVGIATVLLLTVSSYGDFQWFNTSTNKVAYNGSNVGLFYSRTDSTVGCFVQLIWCGPDNNIASAVNSGQGTTGDDVVHQWAYFGHGAFGDQSGVDPSTDFAADTSGWYYVRAWTAPASDFALGNVPTSLTNYYGNSALWSNPGNEPGPDEFNFGGAGDVNSVGWRTDLQVPEPAMIGLGLVGLISLRFFRRRK